MTVLPRRFETMLYPRRYGLVGGLHKHCKSISNYLILYYPLFIVICIYCGSQHTWVLIYAGEE